MHPRVAEVLNGMPAGDLERLKTNLIESSARHGFDADDHAALNAALEYAVENDFSPAGIDAGFSGIASAPYQSLHAPTPEQEFYAQYPEQQHAMDEQEQQHAMDERADAQVGDVEQRLGRPLTSHEFGRLSDELGTQFREFGEFDAEHAAEAVGLKGYSDMSQHEQAQAMADRARDLGGGSSGELSVPFHEDRSGPDWDSMSPSLQAEYMAARALGAQVEFEED